MVPAPQYILCKVLWDITKEKKIFFWIVFFLFFFLVHPLLMSYMASDALYGMTARIHIKNMYMFLRNPWKSLKIIENHENHTSMIQSLLTIVSLYEIYLMFFDIVRNSPIIFKSHIVDNVFFFFCFSSVSYAYVFKKLEYVHTTKKTKKYIHFGKYRVINSVLIGSPNE